MLRILLLKKLKTTQIISTAVVITIIAACGTSKKSSTSTATSTPPPSSSEPVQGNSLLFLPPPPVEIRVPGNEELTAIKVQFSDVTMEKLKEGHTIYTAGACINCHTTKNIYTYGEAQWKIILDDMAQQAKLTDVQKDAVHKFVLSIKATQPK